MDAATEDTKFNVAVIVSAGGEWRVIRDIFAGTPAQPSPCGQWLTPTLEVDGREEPVLFLHGGWGKIAAAASAQYVIDRWSPQLLVNLGTCGGFEGEIEQGDIVLAHKTVVYDIREMMGDQAPAVAHYSTDLDLSWLGDELPQDVRRAVLVSADRDLDPEEVAELKRHYGAVAGDWESGAIAWIARRNDTKCLILRGVSDVVGADGGEAYEGKIHVWLENTKGIMKKLVEALPAWLSQLQ